MNQQQYEYEVMRELELRDYFAAKAMQGLLANSEMGDAALHPNAEEWLEDIASSAYDFADAMIKQRKRK